MTQAITASAATSFAVELAELLLETEAVQSASAREQRDAARADVLREAENQVKALHEAADDMRNGAWASAALSVASSACAIVGSVEQFKADTAPSEHCGAADKALATRWNAIGVALGKLSDPTKTLAGDAPAADANAKAKRSETLAEKAKWVSGDASDEIEKASKLGDKILDLLQGINQDQNSANNAIIGRI
ncbi:MAG: hypothetical protein ABJB12_21755 [Pseudomonadota bacterium]